MPLTAAEQTLANKGTVMGEGERKRNAEMKCGSVFPPTRISRFIRITADCPKCPFLS